MCMTDPVIARPTCGEEGGSVQSDGYSNTLVVGSRGGHRAKIENADELRGQFCHLSGLNCRLAEDHRRPIPANGLRQRLGLSRFNEQVRNDSIQCRRSLAGYRGQLVRILSSFKELAIRLRPAAQPDRLRKACASPSVQISTRNNSGATGLSASLTIDRSAKTWIGLETRIKIITAATTCFVLRHGR